MSQVQVSHIHSRDVVLGTLLPKLLGILWQMGQAGDNGAKATFDRDLEIGATHFRKNGIALSVWTRKDKVLSIQLTDDPSDVEPRLFAINLADAQF